MLSCSCERQFKSQMALTQHQIAKHPPGNNASTQKNSNASRTPRGPRAPPKQSSRGSWMWKNVQSREAIHVINGTTVEPSTAAVSSTSDCELLCTYNWQDNKDPTLRIPGYAPIWQDIPLPVTLPEDKGLFYIDQNASRAARYPFEPMFRAMISMKADFRFDDVDIVVNRNSLRKLLDFCGGRARESFRINLLLVHNTLFIERCERSARELIRGSQNAGWGRNFEHTFTKFPPGLETSTGHHRVLRYALGALNCAVRFEVDACYKPSSAEETDTSAVEMQSKADQKSLAGQISRLSIQERTKETGAQNLPSESTAQTSTMPQSTAAEIKAKKQFGSLGSYMPQVWFGRTPWLIIGRHVNGTFSQVRVTDTAAQFVDWETKHQTELCKLVSVLTQLRETARQNNGNPCIAIYEKGATPRAIKIFPSNKRKRALPDDMIRDFWVSQDVNQRKSAKLPE